MKENFFTKILSSKSGKSSKRFIALVCVGALLLIAVGAFMPINITQNSLTILEQLISAFLTIILFVLGYSTIEKFKK